MITRFFKKPEAPAGDERADDDYKERIYQGILWMKEKYEQYRDLADERYGRLKEQLVRTEKKYEDLVASRGIREAIIGEQPEPCGEPRVEVMIVEAAADHEINARIQDMEEQFAHERQRLEEEVAYLRHQWEEEVARSRRELEEQTADARRQTELQVEHTTRLLDEKQRIIAGLEAELRMNREKIEELVGKLRHNSQLLLNIYTELDKSLHVTDNPLGKDSMNG